MHRIKLFQNSDLSELESEVNKWIESQGNEIFILSIDTTTVTYNVIYKPTMTTITIVYEI